MAKTKRSGILRKIIVILIVLLVATIGYLLWQKFMNNASNSSSAINIPEWSLKGEYDKDTLGDLSYTITDNQLDFTSTKVNSDIIPCEGIEKTSWGIYKVPAEEKEALGDDIPENWVEINGGYYRRIYPETGCENKFDQVQLIEDAFRSLFDTLVKLEK